MRLSLVVIALAACSQVDTKKFVQPTVTKRVLVGNKLDVLFVIDNSASTSDKQTVFSSNFPKFVAALDAFPGGRPDLHLGVVTSTVDIGVQGYGPGCPSPAPDDNGLMVDAARVTSGCTPQNGRYITDAPGAGGTRVTNYPAATLSDALSCIAQVGATGCGFEAPLEGMKRALDGTHPENGGFVRDDADLAVVILTDEDDCSVADPALFAPNTGVGPGDFRCQPLDAYDCTPSITATGPGTYDNCTVRRNGYLHDPQDYVKFLATIKDPSQTMIGLVAGDPQSTIQTGAITSPFSQSLALLPSCQVTLNGNPAIARPANRLMDFVSSFGERGVFQTVCQSDYSAALSAFGQSMNTMMSACLDSGIATTDTDPNNAGLQLACTVTDRDASDAAVGDPFPPCEMTDATTPSDLGPHPCYWLEPGAAACAATPTQIAVHVSRVVPIDPSTIVTQVTCAAAP